jgi:YCII-related domain
MRILSPIVLAQALLMASRQSDFGLCRAVGAQFVGHQHLGYEALLAAGYWIWRVKDLDEAIKWVKRCPNPMPGSSVIEIREMFEMEDFR